MPTPVPRALYERVADQLAELIEAGTLQPGERISSIRKASQQHGISVTTAVQAYLELENRGLVEARPKSGFFVRPRPSARVLEPRASRPTRAPRTVELGSLQSRLFDAARLPGVVPLGAAYPGPENLPVEKMARTMAALARRAGRRGIAYDMPPGAEPLRRQIARRALDWGCHLSPEEIITTCGGTEALLLCLRAVTQPGDVVALESPTYFGILQIVEMLGLRALEIPMHPRDGMDLDALEKAVQTRRIAAVLAVPNFNNPLGSLMPETHKQRLVELLARREIPLIEDDINGALAHQGPRPRVARSYDEKGLVLLCGSASKTIAPGYRVGWVIPGRFFEKVKALKAIHTLATPTLPQLAIAEFVQSGGYDHHLRGLRARFVAQIQRMSEAVTATFPGNIKLTRPQGGFVLWVELPRDVSALELHERALEQGISIAPGPMFSAQGGFANYIRLNCGHAWSKAMEDAVDQLGRMTKKLTCLT